MTDVLLPMYEREFKGGICLKYIGNKLVEGDLEKLKEFEKFFDGLEECNVKKIFDEMKEDVKDEKWTAEKVFFMDELIEKIEVVGVLFNDITLEMGAWLDKRIEEVIVKSIRDGCNRRCKIEEFVFNFTDVEVGEEILHMLSLGANFVIDGVWDCYEARKKYEHELLEYLRLYRRYIEKKDMILEENLSEWLRVARRESVSGSKHKNFYVSVSWIYNSQWMKKLKNGRDETMGCLELDQKGVVVVEADKSCGICLLKVSDVKDADKRMIEELGGNIVNLETVHVEKIIISRIHQFESSLNEVQRLYLNEKFPSRLDGFEDAVLPFLKIRPKVHKMSKEELKHRDISNLKYRPVIDASRSCFKASSRILMEYCRELIDLVKEKLMNRSKWMVKNGHEVANYFKSLKEERNEAKIFTVADMSSAYSYVYLKDLIVAMELIGKKVGIPYWKRHLGLKVATLILKNSYVETSWGVYQLGECLPMGMGMSGEALDVVCLLSELVAEGQFELRDVPSVNGQYKVIIEDGFVDAEGRLNCELLNSSFDKYWRYRDDTLSKLELTEGVNMKHMMNYLGSIFLESLQMEMKLSCLVGSYLDVVFYKKISGRGYETLVRRKFEYPVTFVHASSSMSDKIMKNIIDGEILRFKRMCSIREYFKVNLDCLVSELESRGFKMRRILELVRDRLSRISVGYEEGTWIKKDERIAEREGIVYGSKVIYDDVWGTHQKLMKVLICSLPFGVRYVSFSVKKLYKTWCLRLPMLVPGTRLRDKMFSKKRYMEMKSNF